MARSKPQTPVQRTPSETHRHANGNGNGTSAVQKLEKKIEKTLEKAVESEARNPAEQREAGVTQLVICVGGIYASFLSWAYLQERLTTTTHGPTHARFTFSIFLNTVQSAFAAITGLIYLIVSAPRAPSTGARQIPPIFPSAQILFPLLLIAVTSSLASPFGYASLKHIDYVTFILAKSCKLLPVMFLHISLFRKRYPLYKYMVIASVTLGVAVFTLHTPSTAKKAAKKNGALAHDASKTLGLFLLAVNLLFDGLTNTVQDHIFARFKRFSGPQMMCAQNIISTALTVAYLGAEPLLAASPVAGYIGLASKSGSSVGAGAGAGAGAGPGELSTALAFLRAHPRVLNDVLGFALCGAIGQVFIFHTLSRFSSLLLVTVTVTRKMLTMLLSVLLFGHRVAGMQWLGVALVFGGVGGEAWVKRREGRRRAELRRREAVAVAGGRRGRGSRVCEGGGGGGGVWEGGSLRSGGLHRLTWSCAFLFPFQYRFQVSISSSLLHPVTPF